MMALIENISAQRAEDLRADGTRRRLAGRSRRRWGTSSPHRRPVATAAYGERIAGYRARLTIRRLDREGDRAAIDRVAGRDSADVPEGELLGAELDGELVAAMPMDGGRVVADPFAPTAEAVVLLRRRGEQIRAAEGRGRRRIASRLLRRPLRH
jgi:hypothetical protein